MSLFIIEIHFSGGKVKLLSAKKRHENDRRRGRGKDKKIKVTFCVRERLATGAKGAFAKPRIWVFPLLWAPVVNTKFLTMTQLSSALISSRLRRDHREILR